MRLLLGDCLDKLKELDDNSVDSIVTDPPYGLSFMGKKWDYDVPSVEIWKECLRVLKPGGHLLSFAGSRTYHRMAVRIEDAGFEIRDQIMWIYGSGFPKSLNIGKALDKDGGNGDLVYEVAEKLKEARESRGITKTEADKLFCNGSTNYSWLEGRKDGVRLPEDDLFQTIVNEWPELKPYQEKVKSANREVVGKYDGDMGGFGGERLHKGGRDITKASTDIAKQWDGWGTALKPAHEPIVMARKPISGTVAQNVLEWGTGGINIDECRVDFVSEEDRAESMGKNQHADFGSTMGQNQIYGDYTMLEPQNYNPTGRFPANVIFDEEAGEILNKQSGTSKSTGGRSGNKNGIGSSGIYGKYEGQVSDENPGFGDVGGASRFFYCPKTSKSDRNEGATNTHPTVKPTDLMGYLIRLVTKKGGIVLDPFMGSGSTGKAAVREGMDFVGIEREKEYYEIAEARIQNEVKNPTQFVSKKLKNKVKSPKEEYSKFW